MKITIQVQRYNPETGDKPYFQKYRVEAEPTDRVLSVLMKIKRTIDPTLALRKSCAHGVCGSDAMVINGRERLACKTLIKDVTEKEGDIVRLEPLRTLPVERDLMVDQARFFENYMAAKPYFISGEEKERAQAEGASDTIAAELNKADKAAVRDESTAEAAGRAGGGKEAGREGVSAVPASRAGASPEAAPQSKIALSPEAAPSRERLQSPEDRARIEEATRCILCAACYSACPVVQDTNPEFLGPAAVVQAARFLEDSRDRGFALHAAAIDDPDGIWPCENHFECTRVCPRSIKITKLINRIKRKLKT